MRKDYVCFFTACPIIQISCFRSLFVIECESNGSLADDPFSRIVVPGTPNCISIVSNRAKYVTEYINNKLTQNSSLHVRPTAPLPPDHIDL